MKIKNKKYRFISYVMLIVVMGVLPVIVIADSNLSKRKLKNTEVRLQSTYLSKNFKKFKHDRDFSINFCKKDIFKNSFIKKYLCPTEDEVADYEYFYCADHDDCFAKGPGNWGIQDGVMVSEKDGGWGMIGSATCTNPENSVKSVDCGGATR